MHQTLTGLLPENPVYLTAKSLHAAWANSVALKLAGVTAGTPDLKDGQIQRTAQGEPTGILLENAVLLISNLVLSRASRLLPMPSKPLNRSYGKWV